ncbi:VWA domain-containing protein, partial [bacterium]
MKRFKIIIITLLIISINSLSSQSIKIENVVTTNFPTLRAEFRLLDANGNEVRSLSDTDLQLKDLGITTPFTSPTCPPDESRFSLVLVFDASSSMDKNISNETYDPPSRHTVIKSVAKKFIDQLPDGQFECAIGVFSKDFRYDQSLDFTTNKDSLKQATDYRLVNATNYNAGFLGYKENDEGGAFKFIQHAKYKPVIIFMTDGYHQENQQHGAIQTGTIIQKAKETNTTIFSLSIGPPVPDPGDASLDPDSKAKLKLISESTNGKYYDNLLNESQIQDIYSEILQSAKGFGTPSPCYIDFQSDCNDGEIELTYTGFGAPVSDTAIYTIPDILKPNLDVTARTFLEINPALNQPKTVDVTIKAEKNKLIITGFNTNLPAIFSVSDWGGSAPPFTLNKGESRIIKISIVPQNREFYSGQINFEGSGCSGMTMTPRAGFIFAEDITFANVNQGDQKIQTFIKRFCNLTDEPLKVNNILISGGTNQSDFGITSQNKTLAPGECIDIEATFSPTDQGNRTAEYTVKTDRGDFKANLKGGGAGKPQILASAPTFDKVNCINPKSTKIVEVKNEGPVDLVISNIALDDATNFTYTGPTNLVVPANSTNNKDVTVEFTPQADGVQSANLVFTNNSDNSPYKIKLEGEQLAVNYSVSEVELKFGTICANMGSPISKTITLKNLSSFGYKVNATSSLPEFTTDAPSYDLTSGSAVVTINFEASNNNQYNGVITFTSECGNIIKKVNVSGRINSPEVTDFIETITAVIGSNQTNTVNIKNPNLDAFDVVDAYVGNNSGVPIPEFKVSATSFTIPGSGVYPLDITYTPNPANPVDVDGLLYLVVENPCNLTLKNIIVRGRPDLSVANLSIADDNIDYIGSTTTIPVTLKGETSFENSGTKSIQFIVQYDNLLLAPVNGIPINSNEVSHTFNLNIPYTGTQIYNMQFKVLNGLPTTKTDLKFSKAVALNNTGEKSAGINTVDGIFTVKLANGEATSKDLSASPGENFNLPIYILDKDDVLDEKLHKDLKIAVQYNYTVMQPVDGKFKKLSGDQAEMDITGEIQFTPLPKNNHLQAQYAFANIPMLAKLGNEQVSKIMIKSVDVLSGGVVDFVLDTANFNLTGVCKEGGSLRLFTLSEIEPSIKILENPISSNTNVTLTTIESGVHTLDLYD